MAHQWEAEETIEPPLALQLIQEQFPALSAQHIQLLGAGWDNTAFIIDNAWIFRFPRRAIALPLLETEWLLLPKIADQLPLPVPIPKLKGTPSSHFPWPFVGYQMLPGFTACNANLSEKEREALATPIAQFLSALHSIPISIIKPLKIPGDNHSRIDATVLIPKIQTLFKEMSLLGFLDDPKQFESLLQKLGSFRPPIEQCIVHGDFYVRHLLVDENHQLSGVIDWGDVHLGDPAIDLAIAHSFLPTCAHNQFRKAYGSISDETFALAKLRALYSSSMLVLYGYHSKDPHLLREGLRALKIMVTDPA
jgi:aminoglycoside phosphotransferase (APT) family kinase protein